MRSAIDVLKKVGIDPETSAVERERAQTILSWIVREIPRLRARLSEGLKEEAESLTEFRADSLYRFPQTFSIGSDDRFVVGHIAHAQAKPRARPQAVETEVSLEDEFA
jgi:hypothetical protein